MPLGRYHSIDTFGAVDGRGIRYVLFLAGCKLGCKFCHNPDTWNDCGQTATADQILKNMERYRPYYDASDGGLTVSGGEPLLQPSFVAGLFKKCREKKIHTALDTAGFCPAENLEEVLPFTDAVLFSIKTADPVQHRNLTGATNELILKNLSTVAGTLLPLTLRYVVIPGVNNTPRDISRLARLIRSLPRSVPVELLPYHTMGKNKWENLGWRYPLEDVPAASSGDVLETRRQLTSHGITVLY
jgi:pyruvate formate lyase activating enzyme